MACCAIAVNALPSKGRITSTSTLLLSSVSTWAICWLTSLVPSVALNVTSENFPAWARAFLVIAAIQPWSAAGAEKPILTCLPGWLFAPPPATCWFGAELAAGVLEVHAASSEPAPSTVEPIRKLLRSAMALLLGFPGSGGAVLEQHRSDDDHALGDVLDVGLEMVLGEDAVHHGEDEHPDQRADQGAAPAGE